MQTLQSMLWFDWQRPEHVAFAVFTAVVIVATAAMLIRNQQR